MKDAIKKYNEIMFAICREHNTIGTNFSEDTDGWNLRDMVSEMQYTIKRYKDEDGIYWQDAHDESQPIDNGVGRWFRQWKKEIAMMERFVAKYKEQVLTMKCTVSHCSQFD